MEVKKTLAEDLLESAQAYTRTSIQLFKLKATDKVAEMLSSFASGFVILFILVLFFFCFNIGIALLIGEMFGKYWLGFLILSVFYIFSGLIVYLFRDKWIKRPVNNSVIKQLLNEEEINV
jgi:hypothetical protein